jgi:hypothetical protein
MSEQETALKGAALGGAVLQFFKERPDEGFTSREVRDALRLEGGVTQALWTCWKRGLLQRDDGRPMRHKITDAGMAWEGGVPFLATPPKKKQPAPVEEPQIAAE